MLKGCAATAVRSPTTVGEVRTTWMLTTSTVIGFWSTMLPGGTQTVLLRAQLVKSQPAWSGPVAELAMPLLGSAPAQFPVRQLQPAQPAPQPTWAMHCETWFRV